MSTTLICVVWKIALKALPWWPQNWMQLKQLLHFQIGRLCVRFYRCKRSGSSKRYEFWCIRWREDEKETNTNSSLTSCMAFDKLWLFKGKCTECSPHQYTLTTTHTHKHISRWKMAALMFHLSYRNNFVSMYETDCGRQMYFVWQRICVEFIRKLREKYSHFIFICKCFWSLPQR